MNSNQKFIKVKVIPDTDKEQIIQKDNRLVVQITEKAQRGKANKKVKKLITSFFPDQNPELIKGLHSQNKIFKLHDK